MTWLAMLAGSVVALVIAFMLYSHFLVDYSLEDLEFTLAATQSEQTTQTTAGSRLYKRLVEDLAINEAANEEADLKNLAFLEVAARSLNEAEDRAGAKRAEAYLDSTLKSRRSLRQQWFQILDEFYRIVKEWYFRIYSVLRYAHKQVVSEEKTEVDMSSYLLISQAEEQEKLWQLERAEDLYRRFLAFYPDHPDRSFVTIALAHVLIKEQKYHDAEELLRELSQASRGLEEQRIAGLLMRKINQYKKAENERLKLEQEILDENRPEEAERLKFRLGLLYLQTYNLKDAQRLFREIEKSEQKMYRVKAKFYLGWIYKMQAQYDQGAEILMELTRDGQLDRDLALGAKAQLADIFYQTDQREASADIYRSIADEADSKTPQQGAERAASEAWDSLAIYEQANIYYFDLGQSEKAQSLMEKLESGGAYFENITDLKKSMEAASEIDLRDLGFAKLRKGHPYEAMQFFKKKVKLMPSDAWSYSGLANAYVLLTDLYEADLNARRAYEIQPDEFTASVYAYTLAYQNRYEQAILLYETALTVDPDYIPAKYNLAGIFLLKGEYEQAYDLLKDLEGLFTGYNNLLKAKILNNLGYALWGLNDKKEAVIYFKLSLAAIPGFEDARINLESALKGEAPGRASLA